MFECFHCMERAVIWDCDYDYSDYGYDGEGIIHVLHCTRCGAQIEYDIPMGAPDEEGENDEHDA